MRTCAETEDKSSLIEFGALRLQQIEQARTAAEKELGPITAKILKDYIKKIKPKNREERRKFNQNIAYEEKD